MACPPRRRSHLCPTAASGPAATPLPPAHARQQASTLQGTGGEAGGRPGERSRWETETRMRWPVSASAHALQTGMCCRRPGAQAARPAGPHLIGKAAKGRAPRAALAARAARAAPLLRPAAWRRLRVNKRATSVWAECSRRQIDRLLQRLPQRLACSCRPSPEGPAAHLLLPQPRQLLLQRNCLALSLGALQQWREAD